MPCKPIGGYPSRTEACLGLAARGLKSQEIAEALYLDTSTVAALIASRRRRAGVVTPEERPLHENGRTIQVSNDVLDALLLHAARRGITVNQLVRNVLANVVDDGLVDAVLDDATDLSPRSPHDHHGAQQLPLRRRLSRRLHQCPRDQIGGGPAGAARQHPRQGADLPAALQGRAQRQALRGRGQPAPARSASA